MVVMVTGAGGFIGYHLVKRLVAEGVSVVGVDVKAPLYGVNTGQHVNCDLRYPARVTALFEEWEPTEVYHLAADMGGIGYISQEHAKPATDNSLMDLNMLAACRNHNARLFYASSACVYNQLLQQAPGIRGGLTESDAHPAVPEEGYGWAKLYTEKMCQWYEEDYGLDVRVARFHNVYGPFGTFDGGREKAPAALCRKVALAPDGGEIEIWGDGQQTRSFLYIDDCIEGIQRIMRTTTNPGPLNLGSEQLVTIDELADLVIAASGKRLSKRHLLDKPQGVRGRNSNNSMLRATVGWEPRISLAEGIRPTYEWIARQVTQLAPAWLP